MEGILRQFLVQFFSPKGRMSRRDFWRSWMKANWISMLFLVIGLFSFSHEFALLGYMAIAAGALFIVAFLPLYIKRLHDRGYTGWLPSIAILFCSFLVVFKIFFLSAIVQIWLIVELMRPGVVGENRYGGDPLQQTRSSFPA